MSLFKSVTRSEAVRAILCWLGSLYIRLVHATGRWQVVGGEFPAAFWEADRPFILAFWHGRILMMPFCWRRDKEIHMLISHHRDGRIIARTVSHFGIRTIAGSSSKGGLAALRTMLKTLRAGQSVGITPDGPRGPRMRASDGIVQVARLSGAPVLACSFATDRRRLLKSWDRFALALPFSRGIFVWGAPIFVSGDMPVETARLSIEESLNDVTRRADEAMGQTAVRPEGEGA